jgi:hypothetical protein
MSDATTQALLDREAIADVLIRYDRARSRDWERRPPASPITDYQELAASTRTGGIIATVTARAPGLTRRN